MLQISCVPEELSVFEGLGRKICETTEDSDQAMSVLLPSSVVPRYTCDCLDPCLKDKFKFQVY